MLKKKWFAVDRELEDTTEVMIEVQRDREALSSTISQQQQTLQVHALTDNTKSSDWLIIEHNLL